MAEEKSKEERKIKFSVGWHKTLLEDIRYVEKYGLSKRALEKFVQHDLKFRDSFKVIADYLQQARILILQYGTIEEKKVLQLMERAKYILRGCKE